MKIVRKKNLIGVASFPGSENSSNTEVKERNQNIRYWFLEGGLNVV